MTSPRFPFPWLILFSGLYVLFSILAPPSPCECRTPFTLEALLALVFLFAFFIRVGVLLEREWFYYARQKRDEVG